MRGMATDEHQKLRAHVQMLEGQVATLGTALREALDLLRELNKVGKESDMYTTEGRIRTHDGLEAKLRSLRADLEGWSDSG